MELKFNKIDWRQPPHELKAKIDANFEIAKKAIELIADEVKESHPKLESSDDNIKIEPPKGISNLHKVKLSSRIKLDSLEAESVSAKTAKLTSIETQEVVLPNGKISNDGITLGLISYNLEHQAMTIGDKEEFRVGPYKRTRIRVIPHKDNASYQSIVIQSGETAKANQFNDENIHFTVKGDGCVGMSVFHNLKSTLTLGGKPHAQLTLKHSYTPSSEFDDAPAGTIAWDPDYLYLKTRDNWKRIPLENL